MSAPSHQSIAGPSLSAPSLLHSPTATPTLAPLIPAVSRRRRSLSSSSTDDQQLSSQTQSDTQPSDSPPTTHRRVLKRTRLIQGGDRPDQELGQPSPSPLTTAAPSSTPPATLPLLLPGSASSSSTSPGTSDRRGRRQPLRPTTRPPVRVQNPIVIDSSDSSDEDEVMTSVLAPPAEIVGGSRPIPPNPSPHSRSRRRILVSSDSSPLAASSSRTDPDSSSGDILVHRVIRRPSPIQVLDDSLQDEEMGPSRTTASAISAASRQALNGSASPPIVKPPLRQLQASPPRSKPLPVANPLLSKFTCPICLSTPWPHVVATPCGHVYCSACLFQALQAPVKARQDAVREQMAAFSSLSALQRAGLPASATATGSQHRPHAAGTTTADQTTPSQPSNSSMTTATEATETTNASTRTSMSTNTTNNANTVVVGAPRTSTTAGTSPPRPKVNQLVGTCPFCRAEIPGGFIAGPSSSGNGNGNGNGTARASAKRPVFGLELKIGRPFDDPRRVKG